MLKSSQGAPQAPFPRIFTDTNRLVVFATANSFALGARTAGLATLAALTAPTPLVVGLISAAGFLPWLVIGLWAGYLVDRTSKAKLMMSGSLLAVVCCVLGFLAFALGNPSWVVVLLLSLAFGSINVPVDTSVNSFLPQLVTDDQIGRVNGRMSAFQSSVSVIAPAIAGILLGFSDEALFILLMTLFGGMALLCVGFTNKGSGAIAGSASEQKRLLGMRALWRDRGLAALATSVSLMNVYSGIIGAMLPLYILSGANGTVETVGLIFALQSIGLFVGVWCASLLINRYARAPRLLLITAAACKIPVFLLLLSTENVAVISIAAVINGLSAGLWNAPSSTALIRGSAGANQSHVIASYKMLASVGAPLGALIGGIVSTSLGMMSAFLVGLVLAGIVFVTVVLRQAHFKI